jgi:hypothetical protein
MRHFTTLQLKSAASIWQNAVKSVSRLVGLLERVVPLIVGSSSSSWVKASVMFSRFVVALVQKQGQRGAALYLKGSTLVLMRAISGERLANPRDSGAAVSVSHGGLPRFIPVSHRARIAGGDVAVIRFWLALFTLYRVLVFRGKLSFKTVLAPGVLLPNQFHLDSFQFCKRNFFDLLASEFKVKPIIY